MIKDEKLRDEIRREATKLLNNGQVMSKGVIELINRPEYSKLSYKDVNIIWAEAKEQLKVQEELTGQETIKGKNIDAKDVVKEVGTVEAEFINPSKPKLEVIETIKKIKGQNGLLYIKDSEGVKIGDKHYKDITEVTGEKEAVERRIEAKKEDIRKQIEKLSKELGDIMVNTPKELEKYAEIEAVFSM